MPEKTPAPKPGTTDFRETTKLDNESAPEQMKRDKAIKETTSLDADQHEG